MICDANHELPLNYREIRAGCNGAGKEMFFLEWISVKVLLVNEGKRRWQKGLKGDSRPPRGGVD